MEGEDIFGMDDKQLQELGDEEADALLAELAHSQAEVARMIAEQKLGAADLSGLKDSLTAELEALKQEAWKMQMFGELESLKKQLESIQMLDKDLDAAEAVLDGHTGGLELDPEAAASSHAAALNEEGGEDEDGADLKEIAELQASLDLELAQMLAQLASVRAEAASAAARKEELKKELAALLAGNFEESEEIESATAEGALTIASPEVPA